jgi:hypothetical protein
MLGIMQSFGMLRQAVHVVPTELLKDIICVYEVRTASVMKNFILWLYWHVVTSKSVMVSMENVPSIFRSYLLHVLFLFIAFLIFLQHRAT